MEPEAGPSTAASVAPSPAVTATPASTTDFYFPPTTRRQTRRTTALSRRSTGQGGRLKLKIAGDGVGGSSGGSGGGGGGEAGMARYLQGYDRELDSDVEEQPMAFEEQFILRMPAGRAETDELRDMVERRDVDPEKVWFRFKDSRRAVVNVGKTKFGAKLVDLPCIVESHKTFDSKHTFKIADICQMLLVDDQPVLDESSVSKGAFNIEDFIYPHGLTPPLRHVRKRRFRKRLNKRTIENVEKAVERLLADDADADEVRYDVVDNARDLSDESGAEDDEGRKRGRDEAFTPAGTESMGAPTPAGDSAMDEDERRDEDEEGSIDSDLVAEIEAGLLEGMGEDEREAARRPSGRADDDDDDDDEDDDDGSGGGSLFGSDEDDDGEEEEEEDEEEGQGAGDETAGGHGAQRIRLLHGEVRDLESAVGRKQAELSKAANNPVIRKRVEDSLRKLQGELDSKQAALANARSGQAATAEQASRLEAPDMAAGPSGSGSGSGVDDEDDGLFGAPVVAEDRAPVESMDVDLVVDTSG